MQGAVNQLGVNTIAAYNAVSKIDGFILAPTDSLGLSLTTFTSQNRGANKKDRIRQGMKIAVLIGFVYCDLLAVSTFFAARDLMSLFLNSKETAAISIGIKYLTTMAGFYLLPSLCNPFQGFFRGLGRIDVTLWATLVQIPVRVGLAYLLLSHLGMQAVALGIGVGWICMALYEFWEYRRYLHT